MCTCLVCTLYTPYLYPPHLFQGVSLRSKDFTGRFRGYRYHCITYYIYRYRYSCVQVRCTHVCSFPTRGRRSSRCEKSGRSTRNAIPSSTPGWRHRRPARRRGSGTPRCGGRWASVVEDASQYGMRDKLVEVEVETTEEVIN